MTMLLYFIAWIFSADFVQILFFFFFFFSSRRRHTRYWRDWSSDVCSSDLLSREHRRELHHAGAVLGRGMSAATELDRLVADRWHLGPPPGEWTADSACPPSDERIIAVRSA